MPQAKPNTSSPTFDAGEPFLMAPESFETLQAGGDVRLGYMTEGTPWPEPQTIGGVVILPVFGAIAANQYPWAGTSTERLAMQFLAAVNDPNIKRIVFRINSPGGQAAGVQELSDLIYKHRGAKPIDAWIVNGHADSGAYWIASACDRIIATVGSYAGSIGVMFAHRETSKAETEYGVTWSILSMPDAKKHGNTKEPLSADALATINSTILEPVFDRFANGVARNRGVSADDVKGNFGGGRSLPAADALAAGMIDEIADWPSYLKTIAGGVSGEPLSMEVCSMKFTAECKAFMFAAGVIGSLEADDATCQAALSAHCNAKGIELPGDESAVVAMFKAKPATTATPLQTATQTAEPIDIDGAVADALANDRKRRADITARASLLGLSETDPSVVAALDNPKVSADAFAASALNAAIANEQPVGRVEAGPAALDKFTVSAANALFANCASMITTIANEAGADGATTRKRFESLVDKDAAASCAGMSFLDIAKQAVQLAGIRPADKSDDAIAKAFLKIGGTDERKFAIGNPMIDGGMVAAPLQSPGDLPNLIDGFANKVVMFAIGMAPVTYHRWTSRTDDQPNFNPHQLLTVSGPQEFDEHVDGKKPRQAGIVETDAWLQVDEYSQSRQLTHRMVVQGQLAAFVRSLVFAQIGHERTINRLIVNLLLNNATAPRTNTALFHENHSNIVSSGTGPSITASKAMRKLLNAQPMPGDTEEGGLDLWAALVGSEWHTEALINYDPSFQVTARTQAEVNPFSGLVSPIYEPMLSSGGKVWYGVANPAYLEGIVYAFQSGYGPGGKRVTYYDQATRSQVFDFYGSFGASLVNYEPFVRNPGE